RLAAKGGWQALAAKIDNPPPVAGDAQRAQFESELQALAAHLADAGNFRPGGAVADAHGRLRQAIAFMHRDRAMQHDIAEACRLVRERAFIA
ncbi:MAG TPA: aromatic amino acid lyase, partial [Rhodanobacteraceae bacterium]|nr:aromatic amino acid lyase [Rhodanobacteraceae bacterium]